MRIFRSALLLVFLAFITVSSAFAQTASLTGRVVDAQGGAIANAEISLQLSPSGRIRGTRSNADGGFGFNDVAPGEYVLLVRAAGFADWTEPARVSGQTVTVNATLRVASFTADVTVQDALAGTAATGKTNLPIREMPLTVQAVPGYVLLEQGADDLTAALQNVPGVYAFTNYGVYEGYTFRGFLDLFPSLANQLVDGVRAEGNRINQQLTNIERVEVLKGPSSALYGGGAIGATVNLIRKKPSAQRAYDVSATAGSWGLGRGTLGATGRLTSDALYRLDIGVETRNGYRHNETSRLQITPSIAWRLTDRDQLNVYYTFNRDRFAGDAGIPLLDTDGGTPLPGSAFPDVPRDRNYRTPFDFARSADHNLQVAYARQLNNTWGFRDTLSFRPVKDDYMLAEYMFVDGERSIYREYLQFTHHRKPLTNLAEVTGHVAGPVEQSLVFGWEGQHFTNHTDTIGDLGSVVAEPIDLYDPVETQPEISGPITRIAYFTQNTNAFYGQDHLTLGPRLKAMVGGRIDRFRRSSHNNPVANGAETEGPLVQRAADSFTGRVGLVYQPAAMLDLYGSFATSFRPLTQAQPDGTTLDPEKGRQVEFGQRVHLLNDRLQVNTALFHIVRSNVAFSRPGGFFDQASEVTSNGVEADVTTSLASNWRVNGGYGFTSAKLGDYFVSATTNLKGNTSIMAPRHIFNVWTAYDWPNGFGINLGLRAQSRLFIDRGNEFTIDGYGLLNLGARYRRGMFEYSVVVNNVTDREYFASVLYDSQMYPGDPINVLASVRARFR